MTYTHHSKESNWEERFDLLWGEAPPESLKGKRGNAIKDFIRSLLLSVAQETRGDCVDKFQSALAGEKLSAMGQFKVKQVIEGLLTSLTAPTNK